MTYKYVHTNFNVLDLEKSLTFYKEALGLKEARRIEPEDGSFIIVYLKDDGGQGQLELTWLRDREEPYDLGDEEFHICYATDDYEASLKHHQEMGVVEFINEEMGIYFILDPDGYWVEIVPQRA
ncbi:MAG: VOC family protein [Eubacteriales bacterium]|nr:VOC family protein [Eubacteriales bacterium]